MNLENLQKEHVYWLSGQKLDATSLAQVLQIGVEGETPLVLPECSQEVACSIGLTFETSTPTTTKNSTVFVAKPSVAFASSAMLTQMYNELISKQNQQPPQILKSKSLLKLDEMLNCVSLYKLENQPSFVCQLSVHPSNNNTDSLIILQKILAFCFTEISKADGLLLPPNEIEQNIAALRLYSFAWLCSVVRTLGLHPFCTRLEHLLQFNLKQFFKKRGASDLCKNLRNSTACKDFYYVLMFLCSIGVRRAEPMDGLLNFLQQKKCITAFRKCYDIFEQTISAQSLTISNAALQIIEALDSHFHVEKKSVERSEAGNVLIMVEVFLSWFIKIVSKTTTTQRQKLLRSIVCFDQSICEICCDSDTLHRKFLVRKFENTGEQRCCRMSYSDLCEWLRYMVLLQLDQRNIHSKTEFYIYASPLLYEFGSPPNLTFKNAGMDYLSFFLLESEFIRASLHQSRPKLRKLREQMLKDTKLEAFVYAQEPFKNFIVLCRELLAVTSAYYRLKTIQAVPQTVADYSS